MTGHKRYWVSRKITHSSISSESINKFFCTISCAWVICYILNNNIYKIEWQKLLIVLCCVLLFLFILYVHLVVNILFVFCFVTFSSSLYMTWSWCDIYYKWFTGNVKSLTINETICIIKLNLNIFICILTDWIVHFVA